jgi:hypothetical protein
LFWGVLRLFSFGFIVSAASLRCLEVPLSRQSVAEKGKKGMSVQIESDNPAVARVLERLCARLAAEGAHFDPALVIRYNGPRGFSLAKAPSANMQAHVPYEGPLVSLPHRCLLPYSAFFFALEGDDIVLRNARPHVTPLQRTLMEDMLALYNMTGTFRAHAALSPWTAFKARPDILNALLDSRRGSDLGIIEKAVSRRALDDAFGLFVFFKSRLLTCRLNGNGAPSRVLAPIIDLANHRPNGAGYRTIRPLDDSVNSGEAALVLPAVQALPRKPQCFMRYGRLDAMDTFLHYGFIDRHASFVRSIPVDVQIKGRGRLRIGAASTITRRDQAVLPLKNQHFYVPEMQVSPGSGSGGAGWQAALSHVLIPPPYASHSLRHIIDFALIAAGAAGAEPQAQIQGGLAAGGPVGGGLAGGGHPGVNSGAAAQALVRGIFVSRAEKNILDMNEQYYDRLIALSAIKEGATSEALQRLRILATLQKRKIALYKREIFYQSLCSNARVHG